MRRPLLASTLLIALALPSASFAQSWSGSASMPNLRQILSVDATGENNWPFGSEDLAGDGAGKFAADESRVDVRTLYADADGQALWVRAYFSSSATPTLDDTALFAFIDADDNPATGSGADADTIDAMFTADPTNGGYDIVVGVQADGTELGVWTWDSPRRRWSSLNTQAGEVVVASGLDLDPVLIFDDQHAYLQFTLAHVLSGLQASCQANIFVRVTNPTLGYGDLNAGGARACEAADTNGDGIPDLLQQPSVGCTRDADCPGNGLCMANGACLVGISCTSNGDCAANEECLNQRCVRVVNVQCSADADCSGLVCQNGACVACDAASLPCAGSQVCAPNGTCVAPPPDPNPNPTPPGELIDEVQGGACTCSTRAPAPGTGATPFWAMLIGMTWFVARRRA